MTRWHPMSTAPTSGIRVLLRTSDLMVRDAYYGRLPDRSCREAWREYRDDSAIDSEPTGWMPWPSATPEREGLIVTRVVVADGDWEALYVNGSLKAEGHKLSAHDVLEALGITDVVYEVVPEETPCPESLRDLKTLRRLV